MSEKREFIACEDVKKLLPSQEMIDGDSSSTSSGTSSSPEVDQHLHEQEKKKKAILEAPVVISEESTKDPDESDQDSVTVKVSDEHTKRQPKIRHAYSKEKLLRIKNLPICSVFPDHLLPLQASDIKPGGKLMVLDIVKNLWPEADAPPAKADEASTKKPRDPKERVKQEEQVDVVLSPQRRSFGTGCYGLASSSSSFPRPSSPADRNFRGEPPSLNSVVHLRGDLGNQRRIGSGRIMRRDESDSSGVVSGGRGSLRRDGGNDMDMPDPPTKGSRDFRDWRNKEPQHHGGRYDREDRFDSRRRGFFDDQENEKQPNMSNSRNSGNSRGSNNRGNNRNQYNNNYHSNYNNRRHEEEETPEWFSEGPTSQTDFIELVGFDGKPAAVEESKPVPPKPKESPVPEAKPQAAPVSASSPTNQKDVPHLNVEDMDETQKESLPFNIEDFLENIIGADGNDITDINSGNHQSRLKQFFSTRESPPLEGGHQQPTKGLDLPESGGGRGPGFPHQLPPGAVPSSVESSRYFTPINPVESSSSGGSESAMVVDFIRQAKMNSSSTSSHPPPPTGGAMFDQLMALGGRGVPPQTGGDQHGGNAPSLKELMMRGKGQSLEELEAGLMKMSTGGQKAGHMGGGGGMHPFHHPQGPSNNGAQFTDFNEFLNHVRVATPTEQLRGNNAQNNFSRHQQHHPNGMPHNAMAEDAMTRDPLSKFLSGNKDVAKTIGMMKQQQQPQQPSMPSNAPTEADFLNMLMKSNGGANPNFPRGLNQGPVAQNLQMPPHMRQQQQQGPATQQELLMKLIQQQKLQQQQHQQRRSMQHSLHQQAGPPPSADPIKQFVGGMQQQRMMNPPHMGGGGGGGHTGGMPYQALYHYLLNKAGNASAMSEALISEIQNPATPIQQKETLVTLLKMASAGGNMLSAPPSRSTLTPSPTPGKGGVPPSLCVGGSGGPVSPRGVSPIPPMDCNMLSPHSAAVNVAMAQNRISPLMFGGGSANPTAPQVGAIPPGGAPRNLPSHQELVARAQCIMQKALLKQELEKSKEFPGDAFGSEAFNLMKHRKRDSERGRSPNPMGGPTMTMPGPQPGMKDGSPLHKSNFSTKSQSPLAFTPTSVMRKMTAGKDRTADKNDGSRALDKESGLPTSMSAAFQQSGLMGTKSMPPMSSQQAMAAMNARGVGGQNIPPRGFPMQQHFNPHSMNRQMQNMGPMGAPSNPGFGQTKQPFNRNNQQHMNMRQLPFDNINNNGRGDMHSGGINLAQLLGTDSLGGKLPDLPGNNAFSLEEIERLNHLK